MIWARPPAIPSLSVESAMSIRGNERISPSRTIAKLCEKSELPGWPARFARFCPRS